MANLKDTLIFGSLRATDTLYSTTAQFQILQAPTASNGTTYGAGSDGQVLKTNGTSIYWGTDNDTKALTSMTGILGVDHGGTGQTNVANIQAGKDADGNTISSTYLKLNGGTLTGRLTTEFPIKNLITGTGIAGQAGSSTAAYKPALWKFNPNPIYESNVGDIITIKVPVPGVNSGVWLSMDNGINYFPVAAQGTTRLTTEFAAGTLLTLIFESELNTAIYGTDINGAAAGASTTTYSGYRWRVLNYYNTNTTYSALSQADATTGTATTGRLITAKVLSTTIDDKLSAYTGNTTVTQTATTTNAAYEILFSATADNTTRTESTGKTSTLKYNPDTKILTNGTITLTSTSSTIANVPEYDVLSLGNTINETSTTAHSEGKINLYSAATKSHIIVGKSTTTDYTHTLPNKTGLIVTLDGWPISNIGSATKPVYVTSEGVVTTGSTYAGGTAVTLNDSSKAAMTASFYAPTSSGNDGAILISNGLYSAPNWSDTTYCSYINNTFSLAGDLKILNLGTLYPNILIEDRLGNFYIFGSYGSGIALRGPSAGADVYFNFQTISGRQDFYTDYPAEIKTGLGLGTLPMNVTLNNSNTTHQLGTLSWTVDNESDNLDGTRVTLVMHDNGIGMWNGATENWIYKLDIPVSIENGGTGATTASGARTNLGITPANIGAFGTNSLGTITNANDTSLYGSGFYQANAISNLPTSTSGTYYSLLCFGTAQIAIQFSSNGATKIYTRYYTNSQWYTWKSVALS